MIYRQPDFDPWNGRAPAFGKALDSLAMAATQLFSPNLTSANRRHRWHRA
jgi:hypothetical protein